MKSFYFLCACFIKLLAVINASESVKNGCLEKEKALALLETAEDLLSKAGVLFPACEKSLNSTDESECAGEKPLAYIEISKQLIADVRERFPTCPTPIEKDNKIIQNVKYRNCAEILASGRNESGVYTIWALEPFPDGRLLQVYCDMETDKGGWTVIQRRGKFPVQLDFYKDWESYKNGFGNISEEFWLGNENIRVLCDKTCEIRFDLQDQNGQKGFAVYEKFRLSDINYRISISGYSGDVVDEMKNANNYEFSTKDRGNVEKAAKHKCGWWLGQSGYSANLNGIYQPGKSNEETVGWYDWRGRANLGKVEIKIRQK